MDTRTREMTLVDLELGEASMQGIPAAVYYQTKPGYIWNFLDLSPR
jgi:hypothetical protein